MSPDFALASALATRLLLSQRLYSPRVDVTMFSYDKNIIFDSFANFCVNSRASLSELESCGGLPDGCTIRRGLGGDTVYIILYNNRVRSHGRRSFTLAHEIGHIILGHEDDGPVQEAEANHFAAQLLLPAALVWELLEHSGFTLSAHELARIFATSRAAAENRLRSFKGRPPDFSPDDLLLLKKFGGLLPHLDGPLVDC